MFASQVFPQINSQSTLNTYVLLHFFSSVVCAGGRGGAIATKGGSRVPGPHKSDPNDDSGSLSVILVVILPVAQMIAVLVIILMIRICYRRYCTKNGQSCEPSANKVLHGHQEIHPSLRVHNRF